MIKVEKAWLRFIQVVSVNSSVNGRITLSAMLFFSSVIVSGELDRYIDKVYLGCVRLTFNSGIGIRKCFVTNLFYRDNIWTT